MYFAAWSNSVITNAVYLSNSLKMGEYREFMFWVLFKGQAIADTRIQSRSPLE